MPDATWYKPVCDDALRKIFIWYSQYHRGDPSASRPWVNMDGRVIDKVTRYANKVRFKPAELDHIVRILDAITPTRELVDYFRVVQKGLRKGKLLPGGEYEVVLNAYRQDAEETLRSLLRAKTGRITEIADVVKEQVEQGKSPWD